MLLTPGKLGFGVGEIPEPLLPLGLETASYETVLGLDRFELSLGTVSFIARALNLYSPLLQGSVVVGFEVRLWQKGSLDTRGSDGIEENLGHCVIDPSATYTHAVVSSTVGERVSRTMIAGGGVLALVVHS